MTLSLRCKAEDVKGRRRCQQYQPQLQTCLQVELPKKAFAPSGASELASSVILASFPELSISKFERKFHISEVPK